MLSTFWLVWKTEDLHQLYVLPFIIPLSLSGSVPETHTKNVLSDPYAPFYFDNYINPVRPTELQVDVNGYVILTLKINWTFTCSKTIWQFVHVISFCASRKTTFIFKWTCIHMYHIIVFQFDFINSLLRSMVLTRNVFFSPMIDGNNTSMMTIQMLQSNKQPAISPRWSSVPVTLRSVPPQHPTPSAETRSSWLLRGLKCQRLQVLISWPTHQIWQHFRKLIPVSNKGVHQHW